MNYIYDPGRDEDDDRELYVEGDRYSGPERPLCGCACQEPLMVDTTCDACIEFMREQETSQ
jgi:hypothetical protein